MVLILSIALAGICALAADKIESKEAGFMVFGPEDIPPAAIAGMFFGFGGVVLPPQYKRAISAIAIASVI